MKDRSDTCNAVVEVVVRRKHLSAEVIKRLGIGGGEKGGVVDSLACRHEEGALNLLCQQ